MPMPQPKTPTLRSADGRSIVGWSAGSPIFSDSEGEEEIALATPTPHGTAWLLKPGDIVCDWLKVTKADNRGLLRLGVNLVLYTKIGVVLAFLLS